MDFYCPRCATTLEEIETISLDSGSCATCQGQLTSGLAVIKAPIVGRFVAMRFDEGSYIGAPIVPQLTKMEVDPTADYDSVVGARTAVLAAEAARRADAENTFDPLNPDGEGFDGGDDGYGYDDENENDDEDEDDDERLL